MITHAITKYVKAVTYTAPKPLMLLPHVHTYPAPPMSKLAYGDFIKALPYPKGSFLVHRVGTAWPYSITDVWKLADIQEIHYLCEDRLSNKPRPLSIINKDGLRRWVSHLDMLRIDIAGLRF